MYISKIEIENFGPVRMKRFNFIPEGINVIFGKNAMGKTQILASIYAATFDKSILNHHANSTLSGLTKITFCDKGKTIKLRHCHTNMVSYIITEDFSGITNLAKIEREKLFFYFPDYERNAPKRYPLQDIREVFEFLRKIGLSNHHVIGNCNAKTEMNMVMTVGEQRYLDLMCFLNNIPEGSVVLMDGIFPFFDETLSRMVFETLGHMKNIQFIIAENELPKVCLNSKRVVAFPLSQASDQISPVSYNYKEIPRTKGVFDKWDNDNIEVETVEAYSFRLEDIFHYGENLDVELKEITSKNPSKTIISTAEIYINAYLNSTKNTMGRIFWGIDNCKRIKGVKLTYEEKDLIQRRISETLSQFQPIVDPDLYKISFHNAISQDGQVCEDIYVVEIDVYPHTYEYFFSTSKDEVYIKTEGGKKKLSTFDVQVLTHHRINGKGI